ncbi:DUF4293 family protein [Bacteroides sp. 214]|uniref:DUF4293 domain-containing protein n=1 Tax=Bacteroides sp. 214 TaxID=2302935 RepID=UPI0013D7A5A4|nr:DUF4293 domain-containing protein [Bacteroides sp. 214]NDW13880.1 DUF4293 family protein [Bacteroides sp. 214]
MIQRIQTVYLLVVAALLIASMCLPYGNFILDDNITVMKFTSFGVNGVEGSSWGLFAILLLSTIVASATIFLFRNRVLQIRMTIFNTILLIGYYVAFIVFFFTYKNAIDPLRFQVGIAACLPLIAVILNYLAIRAIGKDEVLVRAADRLR